MEKFIVLYKAPVSIIEGWMATPAEDRKAQEEKMRGDWQAWALAHEGKVFDTAGTGKTKVVSESGVADTKNDVMLYSIVEAESHDEAAQMFVGHPHLGIPEATIEIMKINALSGV